MSRHTPVERRGLAGRLAAYFIPAKLTPIAVLASMLLGLFAVLQLPREEEPQIKVPMADVFLALPGATPQEIENRLTKPLEKLFWEIPGVEYLYSSSSSGQALVIVRFQVGTDIEQAVVRLQQKVQGNADRLPPGAAAPLIKTRTIDDVPILALTLHSQTEDALTLRKLAVQVEEAVKSVPEVAETTLLGGNTRQLRIRLDVAALSARGMSWAQVASALNGANQEAQLGSLPMANRELRLETGAFLRDVRDVESVVVGQVGGRAVFLRDVAQVVDGPGEPTQFVLHGTRSAAGLETAVTLSVAKRPGANAIAVAEQVLAKVEALKGRLLPAAVGVTVTRDYGHTAAEKSNELLLHMGIAVFGVAVLILLFLGWRESLVVLLAIPSTLALTLLVFYLYGYTLNRITLFALIFSIGILVDDAIVVVENIVRHVRLPGSERRKLTDVAVDAVAEVGAPTILATWAVIAAILPMAFVGGLMGPYMRPIPIGSTAAMLFSVVIAFTVTPWAAVRVLRRHIGGADGGTSHDEAPQDWFTRLYHRVMGPLLDQARWRWLFLGGIGLLLAASASLVLLGRVQVKMLPFDNKSEFQVILKTPEGTTLQQTVALAQEMTEVIRAQPEVRDFQFYAGTSAPFNFNGLVRHYYLRKAPNLADIQVNLVERGKRSLQSHAIAKRLRPLLVAVAKRQGATVAVAEVPPGPPVLQSLVAEIYGPDENDRLVLAREVRRVLEATPGVVDVDWWVEAEQPRVRWRADREKAAIAGIRQAEINRALSLATQGLAVGLMRLPEAGEAVPLVLELPAGQKASVEALGGITVLSPDGRSADALRLSELVEVEHGVTERTLYRKNLRPVTYVTADVAGVVESPAYAMFQVDSALRRLNLRELGVAQDNLPVHHLSVPQNDEGLALKWDGEWHITLEVFRDLGLAFAAVLVLIAILMVGWFHSYITLLVVMAAIPFSLVGILPAHWALGAFFTATSMIGFMAGAGIVVRNSIILVDFIELRRREGLPLRDAVIEAGAVRFRPMLLTALAVVVGASVILADPIFQGLAVSLLFGEVASLLISRLAVPVLYFMTQQTGSEPPNPGEETN